MTAVTFGEAAAALGFKSRASLYRLRDSGRLADYLRPGGRGGAQLLELEPPGKRPLREHVARVQRLQANNMERWKAAQAPPPAPPQDHRWEMVAQLASDAAGVTLAESEAKVLAEILPAALAAGFGFAGLERLREQLAEAGHPDVGPTAPPCPAGNADFWQEFGRWEQEAEQPEDLELWEQVAKIAAAMKGAAPPLAAAEARDQFRFMGEALADVRAGARFDGERWAEASARIE